MDNPDKSIKIIPLQGLETCGKVGGNLGNEVDKFTYSETYPSYPGAIWWHRAWDADVRLAFHQQCGNQESSSDCVEWKGACDGHGYPIIWIDDHLVPVSQLVMIMYERFPDPDQQQQVYRRCQNKKCVNINHLSWMTRGEWAAFKRIIREQD